MKKIALLIVLSCSIILSYSQNYLEAGDACFRNCDYECAKKNYEACKLKKGRRAKGIDQKIEKATICLNSFTKGNNLYSLGNYTKAAEEYWKVFEYNPKDTLVLGHLKWIELEYRVEDDEIIYEEVDEPASYPGGEDELFKFLSKNLRYPENATQRGIQGTVILKFQVNSKGEIINIQINQSVHPSLDWEVIRVLRLMPKWTPAQLNGENVNSSYLFPVGFKIA